MSLRELFRVNRRHSARRSATETDCPPVGQDRARQPHRRTGAAMVLIVILLPALFALAAFAVNVAYMESVNTEIQVATDAGARAAGRTYAVTGDQAKAVSAAQDAVKRNPIGSYVVPITAADLEFGISTRASESDTYTFTPAKEGNAVRLATNTLASGKGSAIQTFFPFLTNNFALRPLKSAVSTQGVIDIALVVDRSGSMAYSSTETANYPPAPAAAPPGWDFGDPVPPQARWLDLIAAVQVFNNELNRTPQEELLSLVMYDHKSDFAVPLTDNYRRVTRRLAQESASFAAGGTNIGIGIYTAEWALLRSGQARNHAAKVSVVMTDGVHNYRHDPVHAAKKSAENGIMVFTVTFSDEADQALMKRVADQGGGQHFHAVTAAQLRAAFQDIARQLPTLLTQ